MSISVELQAGHPASGVSVGFLSAAVSYLSKRNGDRLMTIDQLNAFSRLLFEAEQLYQVAEPVAKKKREVAR